MLDELADRYLEQRRLLAPSVKAWRVVRSHLRVFLEFADAEEIESPAELSTDLMMRFQTALFYRPTRFRKPSSTGFQIGVLGTVRGFLAYLLRQRYMVVDPSSALENPRAPRRLPPGGLSISEADRLLAAPDPATVLGCRDRAILETLYATGLRAAELLGLKLGDLASDEPVLRVKKGKGGKDRVVPLGQPAREACLRYIDRARPRLAKLTSSTTLFLSWRGKPLNNTVLNKMIARYTQAAGIKKPVTAHTLRHSCATLMLKGGCDIRYIQALLGHSSLATTQLYTKIDITDLARAHARYHPRSFPKEKPRPHAERYTRGRSPWATRGKKRTSRR